MSSAVEIRELADIADLHALAELFAVVWGRPGDPPLSSDTMKAFAHSENYVAGAFSDGRLIGGLVGWLGGKPPHHLHMHSHILGVLPEREARGVGYDLKQHQRRWCLARGVLVMEWTTDPLLRRNVYFNLTKLGAQAPEYLVDFYGEMRDDINAGEESDRLLIRWQLDSAHAPREPDIALLRAAGAGVVLAAGDGGAPVRSPSESRVLLCQVPDDVVELRRRNPAQAREWRRALRGAMQEAMNAGCSLTGATRSGWYVLESPAS